MHRTQVFLALAAFVAASFVGIGAAAAQQEPTLDEVLAQYEGTTIDDWTGAGFMLSPVCVDAASEGAPAELGAMGFHAVNPARIDFDVVADEPEALLVDGDGNVVGIEYEVPDQSIEAPTVFGQVFDDTPPHPGAEVPHWSLHVWIIDNPAGQFAAFNPALECPTAATGGAEQPDELAMTGTGTTLALVITGLALIAGGTVATRAAQRRIMP